MNVDCNFDALMSLGGDGTPEGAGFTVTTTGATLRLAWMQASRGYRVAWRLSGITDDLETTTVTGTAHRLKVPR